MSNFNGEVYFANLESTFSSEEKTRQLCKDLWRIIEENNIGSWTLGLAAKACIKIAAADVDKMSEDDRNAWFEDNLDFLEVGATNTVVEAILPYMRELGYKPDELN